MTKRRADLGALASLSRGFALRGLLRCASPCRASAHRRPCRLPVADQPSVGLFGLAGQLALGVEDPCRLVAGDPLASFLGWRASEQLEAADLDARHRRARERIVLA